MTKHRARRRVVSSPSNSLCIVPLQWLDFDAWWLDLMAPGHVYLKVPFKSSGNELIDECYKGTVHLVFCKHSDTPRVGMHKGRLCWFFDEWVEEELDTVL